MPTGFSDNQKFSVRFVPVILTMAVITAMVFFSDLLGEREIIFPEIAAISIGCLLAPRRSWQTDSLHIFILISIGAFLGIGIVRYVPLPFYGQIVLSFILAQLIYLFSRTTFAPMVSAVVLPVILQTTSLVYPAAAMMLTGLILLLRALQLKTGIRPEEEYHPLPAPDAGSVLYMILRIACVAVLARLALHLQWIFMIAPPLLVAFTEFSNPAGRARKKPVSTVFLITLCALAGASARSLLTIRFGLPLWIAALTASALLILLLYIYDLYLPPAGAAAILPMLIPETSLLLYPVQIVLGVSILMGLSILLFRNRAGNG